jgi:sec-independent protein translocase protein TatA
MFIPLLFEDIAASEIVVIMLVVLLFFGAKSIPGIAKTLGRTLYEFRNAQSQLQREIQKSGMDIKKDMNISELLKTC